MLGDWDGRLDAESGAAALYMVWLERHLRPAVQTWLSPQDPALFSRYDNRILLRLLAEPELQDLMVRTLEAAFGDTASLLGEDTASWQWGRIHKTSFEHPLHSLADGDLADAMQIERYSRGGSRNTTNNTWSGNEELTVDGGASYRQVIDVGNWDAAKMTNAPGQSGDPRSPFYDNLLEGWANDEYFPLLYSREAVEANSAITITLLPADE